ncbi:glycoside hydrolase family 16 protein [Scleroderma yunnanense]
MRFSLVGGALAIASLVKPVFTGATYSLCDEIIGEGFYDKFNFEAITDPTHGRVNYVDRETAENLGLTVATSDSFILRADDTTVLSPTGPGRNSVRIRSDKTYTTHVAAVWETLEAGWPKNGEIDILEGVNNMGPNQAHLHTSPNCSIPKNIDQLGTVVTTDCDASVNYNSGCGSSFNYAPSSFGPKFNQAGGGWYAVERTNEYISVWYWGSFDFTTPLDVQQGFPIVDTSGWGTPSAHFPNTNCDIASHFGPNNIIIDLTFCGDWAGDSATYSQSGCPSTCVDNPKAFSGAYFQFDYIRIYE